MVSLACLCLLSGSDVLTEGFSSLRTGDPFLIITKHVRYSSYGCSCAIKATYQLYTPVVMADCKDEKHARDSHPPLWVWFRTALITLAELLASDLGTNASTAIIPDY